MLQKICARRRVVSFCYLTSVRQQRCFWPLPPMLCSSMNSPCTNNCDLSQHTLWFFQISLGTNRVKLRTLFARGCVQKVNSCAGERSKWEGRGLQAEGKTEGSGSHCKEIQENKVIAQTAGDQKRTGGNNHLSSLLLFMFRGFRRFFFQNVDFDRKDTSFGICLIQHL